MFVVTHFERVSESPPLWFFDYAFSLRTSYDFVTTILCSLEFLQTEENLAYALCLNLVKF